MRDNCKVAYYTASEHWDFVFQRDAALANAEVLTVRFKPAQRSKKNGRPMNNADRDTYVKIIGIPEEDELFRDFLFLQPPVDILAPTNGSLGDVCLGDDLRHHLYDRGILVRNYALDIKDKAKCSLAFGYNLFKKMALDRDRMVTVSEYELCDTIRQLWEALFLDPKTKEYSAERYLSLFEPKTRARLDTMVTSFSRQAALVLFTRKLADEQQRSGGKQIWLYSDSENSSDQILICEMGLTPVKVAPELYSIWKTWSIVTPPIAKRMALFLASPSSYLMETTAFSRHTAHLLAVFFCSADAFRNIRVLWKAAASLNLPMAYDIQTQILGIHDRALLASNCHQKEHGGAACPGYAEFLSLDQWHDPLSATAMTNFICDCGAFYLAEYAFDTFTTMVKIPGDCRAARVALRHLAASLPRSLCVGTSPDHPTDLNGAPQLMMR